jgi:hypothetical protein
MKRSLFSFNTHFGENHSNNLYWIFALAIEMIFIGLGLRDLWPSRNHLVF